MNKGCLERPKPGRMAHRIPVLVNKLRTKLFVAASEPSDYNARTLWLYSDIWCAWRTQVLLDHRLYNRNQNYPRKRLALECSFGISRRYKKTADHFSLRGLDRLARRNEALVNVLV